MKNQWKTDIKEVSKNDLWIASNGIENVTECGGPYECNYAHGGKESLEPT